MDKGAIIQALLGILMTISMAIGGWSLRSTMELSTQMALVTQRIEQMTDGRDTDIKHWKYLSQNRYEIKNLFHILDKKFPNDNIRIPGAPDLN